MVLHIKNPQSKLSELSERASEEEKECVRVCLLSVWWKRQKEAPASFMTLCSPLLQSRLAHSQKVKESRAAANNEPGEQTDNNQQQCPPGSCGLRC